MDRMLQWAKGRVRKAQERDRRSEPYAEAASRRLWPWREPWLLALVGIVAIMDYISTCAFLEITGSGHAYEGGVLASWALRMGGLGGLFLADIGAVLALSLVAVAARSCTPGLASKVWEGLPSWSSSCRMR